MADGSLGNAFFADYGPSPPPSGTGSINGVTAGAGLAGGGTIGVVTLSLQTPVAIANGGTGATTATGTGALVLANSPALLGAPTAPTPATADSSTHLATTAFVKAQNYITGNQTITLSGDITGSGTTAITSTLATVNANVGTFGDASHVAQITIDAKGRITAASNVAVAGGGGAITGVTAGTGLTGGGTTGTVTVSLVTPVAVVNGGTGVTTSTGSGANVLATSPALVTPNLGTPSAVNLANATNLPSSALADGVTGTGPFVMASGPSINSPTVTGGLSTDTLTASGNIAGAALLATGTAVPPAGWPGIYRPAPNQIGFSTNGVNRWTINVSGVLTNQNAGGALNVYGIGGITTGYANSGAAGVALTMSGSSANGGTVHISTASVSTDGPIAIGPATTPNAMTIAVNGLTTLANGLTVTGTATFNNSLYLGGTPTYGVLLNTNPVATIGVGTTGQALTSQGASAAPVYTTAAAGIVLATGANNPAAPTSNTGAMAGLGALFTFTPARSGRVMITVSGHANILVASPANAGILLQLYYGTGAAPANGAAVTGTSLTASVRAQTGITLAAGGADFRPVTLIGVITGLAVGTTYWVDVSQAQTLSGTPIAFANITFNFLEQ